MFGRANADFSDSINVFKRSPSFIDPHMKSDSKWVIIVQNIWISRQLNEFQMLTFARFFHRSRIFFYNIVQQKERRPLSFTFMKKKKLWSEILPDFREGWVLFSGWNDAHMIGKTDDIIVENPANEMSGSSVRPTRTKSLHGNPP